MTLASLIRTAALGAALSLAAGTSQAAILTWTISNGTFDDGGAFFGTATENSTTDQWLSWNITTTGGTDGFANTYSNNATSLDDLGFFNGGYANFFGFIPFSAPYATLFQIQPSTVAGPGVAVGVNGDEVVGACGPVGYPDCLELTFRMITGGTEFYTIAAVPEPGALGLLSSALVVLGAIRRRRTRS